MGGLVSFSLSARPRPVLAFVHIMDYIVSVQ
jgi:hypothetical protein